MSAATTISTAPTVKTLIREAARILDAIGVEDQVAVKVHKSEGRLYLVFDVLAEVVPDPAVRERLLRALADEIGAQTRICDYEDGLRLAFATRNAPGVTYSAHTNITTAAGVVP